MFTNDTTGNSSAQYARRGTRRVLDTLANRVSANGTRSRFAQRNKLRRITGVPRVRDCGQALSYNRMFVHLTRDAQGKARYSGLETCRRVWLCPVCAPRISAQRAEALQAQISDWITRGGAVWFLTLTFPHDYEDALKVSAKLAARAFTSVLRGRAAETDRERYDVAGFVRALEVTTGPNGWHPHLHVLVFLNGHRGVRARRAFHSAIFARFARFIVRAGFRPPDIRNCPIEVVETATVGAYVAKANGTAREMTAGHLKRGRGTSRTPMQLLDDAINGDSEARRLWAEYEPGMHGRRQLTYTRALRAQLFPESDSGAVDGTAVADASAILAMEGVAIYPSLWRRISEVDGLDRMILVAFGQAGFRAALDCVIDGLKERVTAPVVEAQFRHMEPLERLDRDTCCPAS